MIGLFATVCLIFGACHDKKAPEILQASNFQTATQTEANANKNLGEITNEFAKMQFDNPEHKFGKVQEGEMVKHTFKFKNTGTIPLIISEVAPQCGCTSSSFTKTPIAPNESGEITLELDTKNKRGEIDKNARIVANVEGGNLFIYLRGEVISTDIAGPNATPR